MAGEKHSRRRQSLLLILELCRQADRAQRRFDDVLFSDAVYYGESTDNGERFKAQVPEGLNDIAKRWQMFYFHYYMSVALEGFLLYLLSRLGTSGLKGEELDSIVASLDDDTVRDEVAELVPFPRDLFSIRSSPASLYAHMRVPRAPLDSNVSACLDARIRPNSAVSECELESLLRRSEFAHPSTGLAVSFVLLATTLGRHKQWEKHKLDNWLMRPPNRNAAGAYWHISLFPRTISAGLTQSLGDWWNAPWREIAEFVLFNYVVRQHLKMANNGGGSLLHVDGKRLSAADTHEKYEKIGVRNARFHSAVQILVDLGLLDRTDEGDAVITKEGKAFLKAELTAEARARE